jgi:hypothetical protein
MNELVKGIYIVGFNSGISNGIAKLGLRTAYNMDGILFYVSEEEYEDFQTNVVNTHTKWRVANKNKEIVEIPGTWRST